MLSELLSIAKKLDVQEITGLDERCMQILFFLLLNIDREFNHNQLRNELNNVRLSFHEPTYSRHLDHLEERRLIKRTRNHTTTIKLNIDNLDQKLKVKKAIQMSMDKLNEVRNNLKSFTPSEIFDELKKNYIEKGSASLLIKLRYINNSIPENEFHIGYLWINLLYEFLIDIYIDEIKVRGQKTITEILNLYYKT